MAFAEHTLHDDHVGGMASELGTGTSDPAAADALKEQFAGMLISPDHVARAVLYAIEPTV